MAYYRNEEQHARKLDHIATFCAGILAAEGPAALEPNQIGRRIDGSGYNVSNIFPNRAALVALVVDRHTESLLAAVGQPEDWPGEPRDQLLAMATAYLERVSAARGVHAVLPDCRRFLPPATQDAHANCRRWIADAFATALADALPAATQDPRLRLALSTSLLAMLDGWVTWTEQAGMDAVEFAEVAVGMVTG